MYLVKECREQGKVERGREREEGEQTEREGGGGKREGEIEKGKMIDKRNRGQKFHGAKELFNKAGT